MPVLQLHLDHYRVSPQFALERISIDLPSSFCIAIVGKSGCGKSTLLKILAGFERNTAANLTIHGKNAQDLLPLEWQAFYRQVAFIGQNYLDALSPKLSAWDILTEPLRLAKLPIHEEQIIDAIKSVGLEKVHLQRTPEELSGGQNQRLLIARALLLKPEVILCDEITSGLDLPQKVSIAKLLANLKREKGISIVFVTHEVLLLPFIADTVITMKNGKIIETSSVEQLFNAAESEETKILLEASLLKN